jgi:hypothetical protein
VLNEILKLVSLSTERIKIFARSSPLMLGKLDRPISRKDKWLIDSIPADVTSLQKLMLRV